MEPKKILMIDDEEGFTALAKLNLEKTGRYVVQTRNTAEDAVGVVREFQPDLVLLDIVMPDRDGGEVLAELQAEETTRKVPVAFLTATLSIQSVADRGNQINGVPFIAKPIAPRELMREIEIILKNHH